MALDTPNLRRAPQATDGQAQQDDAPHTDGAPQGRREPADFFRPSRTYAYGQDGYTAPELTSVFRVEHITRHPDRGHLRAIGWAKSGEPGARWHGTFLDEHEFTGWVDITQETERSAVFRPPRLSTELHARLSERLTSSLYPASNEVVEEFVEVLDEVRTHSHPAEGPDWVCDALRAWAWDHLAALLRRLLDLETEARGLTDDVVRLRRR